MILFKISILRQAFKNQHLRINLTWPTNLFNFLVVDVIQITVYHRLYCFDQKIPKITLYQYYSRKLNRINNQQ